MANLFSTDLESGSNQFWSIADASQTGLDITGDMTLAGWFKLESAPSNTEWSLISKHNGAAGGRSYLFRYVDTAGVKTLSLRISSDGGSTNQSNSIVATTLNTSTYYHVAVQYTAAAGEVKFFVDSSQVGLTQVGAQTSIFNGNAPFEIGHSGNGSDAFDGLVDDVQVYSNVSVSISDLYNAPCAVSSSASGLQGRWEFENNGDDSTANNNDLTNNNLATFSADVAYSCAVAGGSMNLMLMGVGT